MKIFGRCIGFAAWLTIAAALLLPTQNVAASDKEGKSTLPVAVAVDTSQYVGSETCKTCHEDLYKNLETTRHWKTTLKSHVSAGQGCESCHGPGKAHVEGGGDKSKIFRFSEAGPGEASKRCMSCHAYGEEHANFDR